MRRERVEVSYFCGAWPASWLACEGIPDGEGSKISFSLPTANFPSAPSLREIQVMKGNSGYERKFSQVETFHKHKWYLLPVLEFIELKGKL